MENLIKLRKERGLTTRQIGELLGISKGTFNHWETGRCEPDIATLKKLADFFCVSIDYLVGAEVRTVAPMGEALTNEETDLLTFFRGVDVTAQRATLRMLKSLFEESNKTSAKAN